MKARFLFTEINRFGIGLSVVLLSMFLAAPAFCLPMVTIDYGTWRGNSGGEFLVTPTGILGIPDGAQFNTWCIEKNEYISLPGTYDVEVSTEAVKGGIGGGSPDPLGAETAWLYSLYLDDFVGFAPTYLIDSTVEARDFQEAIWVLEDELERADLTDSSNKYLAAADGSGATSIGNVKVLNLYVLDGNGDRVDKQSQLVRIPDATTLSLLGSAMVIAALFGRRKRFNA